MSRIRIGNAHGFWGDRLEAAAEMLLLEPALDFLTLDFLAEVSMSILAAQRSRDPGRGYAADFVEIVESLAPYWRSGGRCRVISNAGGLNPAACAEACRRVLEREGCDHIAIATVSGDDVLEQCRQGGAWAANLDTGQPIEPIADQLVTANAYLGARPIVEALASDAQLVITGRVADPSMVVAPCVQHHGWSWDDWDRLAGATVAGHLVECGAQVTGGIATDWLDVPRPERIGFPIVEVDRDGSCIVTKPQGSGGHVTEATVREQLVYEIGDPGAYLSPDVIVSFLSLSARQVAADRVAVTGAKGRPAPPTLKVSATCEQGYRAAGQLTVFGEHAVQKARRAAETVLQRLEQSGVTFRETVVEFIGSGACDPAARQKPPESLETVLRIAVADDSRENVERFSRSLMALVTAGPPGTTGYAEGRPRVHPAIRYWPCLIDAGQVEPFVQRLAPGEPPSQESGEVRRVRALAEQHGLDYVELHEVWIPDAAFFLLPESVARENLVLPLAETDRALHLIVSDPADVELIEKLRFILNRDIVLALAPRDAILAAIDRYYGPVAEGESLSNRPVRSDEDAPSVPRRLGDIALARSGDKGRHANIGVIARPGWYARLESELTCARVARHLGIEDQGRVNRYPMPNIEALNFIVHDILDSSLRLDAQGKALGQVLLRMPWTEHQEG